MRQYMGTPYHFYKIQGSEDKFTALMGKVSKGP